jgi:hypothetical protein
MNGAKETTKIEKLLNHFIDQINKNNLNTTEISILIQKLLYSIGSSISDKTFSSSEEVMFEYYSNPNFWNALMAQSLIMKDKWKITGEE